ncbi:MAG: CPBP family intramembrane metalloprotease [Coriobacteriia bacterium]|nr:CPBP family intramembrane metalloprotease [Coriobacteriia bacterium]
MNNPHTSKLEEVLADGTPQGIEPNMNRPRLRSALLFTLVYVIIFMVAQIIAGLMIMGPIVTNRAVRAASAGTLDLADESAMTEFMAHTFETQLPLALPWITIVGFTAAVLICAFIVKKRGFSLRKFAGLNPARPTVLLFSLMLGIGLSLSFNSVLALPGLEFLNDPATIEAQAMLMGSIFMAIAASTIVPIAEEIIFRGFMMNELRRTVSLGPSIVFSSVVFGVLHGTAAWILIATLLGLIFAWVALRTRSVYASILTHVGVNATSFTMVWLTGDTLQILILSIAGGTIILVGSTILLFRQTQPISEIEPPPEPVAAIVAPPTANSFKHPIADANDSDNSSSDNDEDVPRNPWIQS